MTGLLMQSGRFGAATVTPDQISGLQLWLKPEGIVGLNDGDSITSWPDSSGNGRDLAPGAVGVAPIYKTGIINSRPVARFNGITQDLVVASVCGCAQQATIMAVILLPSSSDKGNIVKMGGTGDGYAISVGNGTGDINGNNLIGLYENVRWIDSATALGTTAVLVEMTVNGATAQLYKNGATVTTPAGAAPTSPTTLTSIGAKYVATGIVRPCAVDIMEVLIFNAVLSAPDLQSMEDYLGGRAGIVVT